MEIILLLVYDVTQDNPIGEPPAELKADVNDILALISEDFEIGLWRTEYSTSHVYLSETAARIYGIEPTDKPANLVAVNKLIHPEDLPLCLDMFETAAREKSGFQYTLRISDGKGGYKFVRSVGRYRETANGAGELIGIFHEVPELMPRADD